MLHILVGRTVANGFIDGDVSNPSMFFASESTLGFYRVGAGQIGCSGRLLFPNGTAAVPAMAFASETNTGIYFPTTNVIGFTVAGTARAAISTAGLGVGAGSIGFTSGSPVSTAMDVILNREGPAILELGNNAAGVTDQMFKGPDRITSDGVGGALYLAAGRNRGASAGGSLIFQTSPVAGAVISCQFTACNVLQSYSSSSIARALDILLILHLLGFIYRLFSHIYNLG